MVLQDAKSKHEQMLEIVNNTAISSRELGIIHLSDENELLDGRHVRVKGNELVNFGTCGYMGLEMDDRLKHGVIDAVQKYGTGFASTRAYITVKLYEEIESLLACLRNPYDEQPEFAHYAALPPDWANGLEVSCSS